jgi:hypothetical protein
MPRWCRPGGVLRVRRWLPPVGRSCPFRRVRTQAAMTWPWGAATTHRYCRKSRPIWTREDQPPGSDEPRPSAAHTPADSSQSKRRYVWPSIRDSTPSWFHVVRDVRSGVLCGHICSSDDVVFVGCTGFRDPTGPVRIILNCALGRHTCAVDLIPVHDLCQHGASAQFYRSEKGAWWTP